MGRQKTFTVTELERVLEVISSEMLEPRIVAVQTTSDLNQLKSLQLSGRSSVVPAVEWPPRTTSLLRSLRAAIEGAIGHQLSLEELSEITSEAKSTLSNWFAGDGNPTVEVVLRLMERVPVSIRHQILDGLPISRCYPTLSHPRLAHDPVAISRMQMILSQPSGTTLVHGTKEELVTFTVAAMGHTYYNSNPRPDAVRGIDVHRPDWYIQVPGVQNLNSTPNPERIKNEIASRWISIQETTAGMLIFNGIWPQMTNRHEAVRELARQNHVIIGTPTDTRTAAPIKVTPPAHTVAVMPERLGSERIQLEINAI
jgi:hypothetical protein